MMMIDNTEDNEFRKLLSDYTAPIKDDGFIARVLKSDLALEQARAPNGIRNLKGLMIGSAAILAAIIAGPQSANFKHMFSRLQLPELALPTEMWQSLNTPNLAMLALMSMLVTGLAGSFLFGGDV